MANRRKQRCQKSKRNSRAKRQRPKTGDDLVATMKIVDVNNDCLEHVFNYLDLLDLINVADANSNLRRAAASVFSRKYACSKYPYGNQLLIGFYGLLDPCAFFRDLVTGYNIPAPVTISNGVICLLEPAPVFRILRLFGEFFTRVEIHWDKDLLSSKNYAIDLREKFLTRFLFYVNEFCSETLISFATNDVPAVTYSETMKPYKNVEVVSIETGPLGFNASQFNDTFPKMRRLTLDSIELSYPNDFAIKFNQLEDLRVRLTEQFGNLTTTNVKEIIRLNPQLQSLMIGGYFDLELWDYANKQLKQLKVMMLMYNQDRIQMNPSYPIRFEQVETLEIFVRKSNVRPPETFLKFKNLKELKIHAHLEHSWIDFVFENPTIEKLSIITSKLTSDFPYPNTFDEDMMKILTNLPKLVELHMENYPCSMRGVIRFLHESKTLRKFYTEVRFKKGDDSEAQLAELHSTFAMEWYITIFKYTFSCAFFMERK